MYTFKYNSDGGFYDSLTNVFTWASKFAAKKEIYEALRLRGTCESPYHGIISALDKHADLKITGLLIEVADRPSSYSLALGAAILVVKSDALASTGKKWKMNAVRAEKIMKDVRTSDDAKLVKCTMDELVGLAFASQLPIIIADSVYNPVSVDGILEKFDNPLNSKISMTAPYFGTSEEAKAWRLVKKMQRNEVEARRKKTGAHEDFFSLCNYDRKHNIIYFHMQLFLLHLYQLKRLCTVYSLEISVHYEINL